MNLLHAHAQFPFGLSAVENYEETCRHYAKEASMLSLREPLPSALPRRHLVLQRLEGRFPVQDAIPTWWHTCVDALVQHCPCSASLLRELSREEFRRGFIEQAHWKRWRAFPCQHEEHEAGYAAPACYRRHGPNLYSILEKILPESEPQKQTWMEQFICRGSKNVPQDMDLVLTSAPEWWLNMSNGWGWSSCMGRGEDRAPRIIGNWYDTGVLLAALVARGADCWSPDSLIARTTVRLVWEREVVCDNGAAISVLPATRRLALGRVYHNDMTSAYTLLVQLASLFEAQGLPWGCIVGTNAANYACSGVLGSIQAYEAPRRMLGVAFWRPKDKETPYFDGEGYYWDLDEGERDGLWAYPLLSLYPCRLFAPHETEARTTADRPRVAATCQLALREEGVQ